MNKQRLEWIMSGLNQYLLTEAEDRFLQTVAADFDKNQSLTAQQEERLELFYKQKSQFIPNKNRFAIKENGPKKVKPRRPNGKLFSS